MAVFAMGPVLLKKFDLPLLMRDHSANARCRGFTTEVSRESPMIFCLLVVFATIGFERDVPAKELADVLGDTSHFPDSLWLWFCRLLAGVGAFLGRSDF